MYWKYNFFRFSTSKQTLTLIPDTFFTALLSGRISSLRDEKGAIFIDRDPEIFSVILNYLRTREIDLHGVSIRNLRHEAEYYNIAPLVKRLILCEELTQSTCGDVLFYGYLPPPCNGLTTYLCFWAFNVISDVPVQEVVTTANPPYVETTGVHTIRPGSSIRIPDGQNNDINAEASQGPNNQWPTHQPQIVANSYKTQGKNL